MIIVIKKDGQIVADDGNPIEGKALEGAYMLLADAQDGDTIVYDGTNHMWKAGQGGGSFTPDITDPQDGDTLVYNSTQQKWVNGAGAGGVLVVHIGENDALDKTTQEIIDAQANKIVFFSDGVINDSGITTYILSTIIYSDEDLNSGYKFLFYDSSGHASLSFNADDLTSYPVYSK